jgi:hypothetical protein
VALNYKPTERQVIGDQGDSGKRILRSVQALRLRAGRSSYKVVFAAVIIIVTTTTTTTTTTTNNNNNNNNRGSRVRFPVGAGNFSLHHCVQNGFGVHPASCTMGTRGSFLGDKAAGA